MAGKRRKYRRSSILSHSHPQTPEAIPTTPLSQKTNTPASGGFGTPSTDNIYTPTSECSPLARGAIKEGLFDPITSKTPICDALVRRGTLPDRGPAKPWPGEPAADQIAWRTPCEMNGIHNAMGRIPFKEKLMGSHDDAPNTEQPKEPMSVQCLSDQRSTHQCTLSNRQLTCLQEWNKLHCKWTPLLYEQSLFPPL
jgi:hypothetical protein